jgi:hypothetical protein
MIDPTIESDVLNLLDTTDLPNGTVAPAMSPGVALAMSPETPEAMPPVAALSDERAEPRKACAGVCVDVADRVVRAG